MCVREAYTKESDKYRLLSTETVVWPSDRHAKKTYEGVNLEQKIQSWHHL